MISIYIDSLSSASKTELFDAVITIFSFMSNENKLELIRMLDSKEKDTYYESEVSIMDSSDSIDISEMIPYSENL